MNHTDLQKASRSEQSARGQVLIIVAVGMFVIIGLVGLVIDGGYAWGQQRQAQNGADAVAEAGATVMAHSLKGVPKTDGDVGCAVEAVAAANGLTDPVAVYTDVYGDFLTPSVTVGPCNAGGGAAIPPGAQGVKASGDRDFETFLAKAIGFTDFTTSASATAVAGLITEICPASAGCGVLPVTFPLTAVSCDGQNRQLQIPNTDWPLTQLEDPTALDYADADTMAIIPLCSVGPGSVGWLDFGPPCPNNLANVITTPCNVSLPIPVWIKTSTGNVNNLEDELNDLTGPQIGVADDSIVLIPINDNTCRSKPPDSVYDCPEGNGSGNGSNLYYHIPKFTRFMIDRAHVQGANVGDCNSLPGAPFVGGSGGTGCLKGWFLNYVEKGPVGPGATGPLDPGVIGIQLIR
jgi:hypothetical protein